MIYLLSVLFTVMFVFYSKWQFYDDKVTKNTGKWHMFGMTMRLLAVFTPLVMQYFPATWQDYLLAGSINVLLWEILINKVALEKDWFYIGTTANTDKLLGRFKWDLYTFIFVVCLAIKIFT